MAHRDFSPASQDTPIPVSSTSVPASSTSVFINHHDLKVQKTLASHLHRRLRDHGLEVFFKWLQLAGGDNPLTCEIEGHIREASVHVAVFSPGFAESRWCLNELMLRLESMKNPESGLKIIPVFYGVEPSELRWTKGVDAKGVYAEALRNFQEKNPSESNIEKWRKALYEVAEKTGFELRAFNGDEGKLVDKIVKRVLKMLENHLYYHVFINHRGPDTKRTLASHLYHCLLAHGLRVFLDAEELQIAKRAIATASVHIAIFSPGYAESSWCLEELTLMSESMLESGSTIIPVFYHVRPSEVRWTRSGDGQYSRALKKHKSRGRFDTATIKGWRNALSQAADISGFELEQYNNDEGKLVHEVVQKVLSTFARRHR